MLLVLSVLLGLRRWRLLLLLLILMRLMRMLLLLTEMLSNSTAAKTSLDRVGVEPL